jgi:molybdenum transport protein
MQARPRERVGVEQAGHCPWSGADVVQPEKLFPDAVAALCGRLAESGTGHAMITVAGGVNAGNAAAYAKAGRISS